MPAHNAVFSNGSITGSISSSHIVPFVRIGAFFFFWEGLRFFGHHGEGGEGRDWKGANGTKTRIRSFVSTTCFFSLPEGVLGSLPCGWVGSLGLGGVEGWVSYGWKGKKKDKKEKKEKRKELKK